MSGLVMSRARLRADSSVRALAPLLLPDDPSARLLASHRLVWSLMSDDPGRARDFLWREERPGAFLILAPRAASTEGGLFDVEHKPWAPALRAGDRLGFAMRAHATVSRANASGGRGARFDVVMNAIHGVPKAERAAARPAAIQQAGAGWLTGQAARHGFALETVRVDGYDTLCIPRPGAPIAIGTLEFDGVLTVVNPAALVAVVAAGFGRARAFGQGLMLLRRV